MRYAMMIFLSVVFLLSDQMVKTENNTEIILKDDSTWVLVDSTAELKSPLVTTRDSQTVFLRDDGICEYMDKEGTDSDTRPETIPVREKPQSKVPILVEVIPYYKADVKPVPISMPTPRYPEHARQSGIEGTVVVQMLIDVTGNVIEVKIIKSSGNKLLDKAAFDAAMKSTFSPAEISGRKVRVWVSRPIKFQLTH